MTKDTKGSAILLVLLLLVVGGVVGYAIGIQGQSNIQPFPEHQSVINTIIIKDTKFNYNLVPICVHSSQNVWAEHSIIPLATFEEGRVYKHTTWIWQRYGDTEISMTLWGPGEDQNTISIEIGRLGANPFEVKVAGETELTIAEATAMPSTGYYHITVQLSATS